MQSIKQQLPPLNSLVTFEAAARHLSFTLAAKELNVTQAAVSRQIKTLEEAINSSLFTRFNRRLALTDSGIELLPNVQHALQILINSCAFSEDITTNINICSTIAFSTLKLNGWLLAFEKEHPMINIKLTQADNDKDLDIETFDLMIGSADYADKKQLRSTFLFSDEVFPICSPDYLKQHPTLESIQDLLNHPLIHLDVEHWRNLSWQAIDWNLWFKSQGINLKEKLRGLSTNNYPLLLQSVINNNGVALGWRHLVSDMLTKGELVRPLDASYKSQHGYYLLEMQSDQSDQVNLLKKWIIKCSSNDY
jgi:DNA-binding transcriptional LysR family regulator